MRGACLALLLVVDLLNSSPSRAIPCEGFFRLLRDLRGWCIVRQLAQGMNP